MENLKNIKEMYINGDMRVQLSKGKSTNGSTLNKEKGGRSRQRGLYKAQSTAGLKLLPDHPGQLKGYSGYTELHGAQSDVVTFQ